MLEVLMRALASCVLLLTLPAVAAECTTAPLNLAEADRLMILQNPQLAAARHAVDGSRADVITAGERPNPAFSANSSAYNLNNGLGNGNAWRKRLDTVFRIDQLIERGGKRDLRLQAAQAALEGSRDDYQDLLRQSRLLLAQSYYDLALAQRRVTINEEISALQLDTLHAAQKRLQAGDIGPSDVARIQLEAIRAENDLQRARADLRTAQIALGQLLGCGAGLEISAAEDWPNAQAAELVAGTADARQRPDVSAAAARLRQARHLASLAEAQATRDVSVGLQFEHYPPDGDRMLGAGISIPLFLYHRYEGEIERARADAAVADETLAQAQAAADADLARARSDLLHSAARSRRAREELLPQAQKAAGSVEFAYQHGAAGLLDLLDARRSLRAARLECAESEADYAKALSAWKAATTALEPNSPSPSVGTVSP